MNPYVACKEAPFHPHDLSLPTSSRHHGLPPPPNRRFARDLPQQHRGAAPANVAPAALLGHQMEPAPPEPRRMSEAALRMSGPAQSPSRPPSAASGGFRPPRCQTLGAPAAALHPRQSTPGALQMQGALTGALQMQGALTGALQMQGALAGALHPPHPQMPCAAAPGALQSGGLQQAPHGAYAVRKLPESDAPPNVTVSTSTIPLSMAASLHHRGGDLSSIVHQINRLCQARAGAGATSVCEGQIANPSPISRNLLINASSRVSAPGHPDALPAPPAAVPSRLGPSVADAPAAFPADAGQVQRRRVWIEDGASPEGVRPFKNLRSERAFPGRSQGYLCKPPSPVHPLGPYTDGDCANSPWGGSRVPTAFQAGRVVGAKYRLREESFPVRAAASELDFLGSPDLVTVGFPDPEADLTDGLPAGPPRNAARAFHGAYR